MSDGWSIYPHIIWDERVPLALHAWVVDRVLPIVDGALWDATEEEVVAIWDEVGRE